MGILDFLFGNKNKIIKDFATRGAVIIDGNYKNGKKHGVWKHYKNGKLVLEETYPKPVRD